jgi:hypothetical protein
VPLDRVETGFGGTPVRGRSDVVTVVMNDDDYAILVEAVEWVRVHAGVDAPQYPQLRSLLGVIRQMRPRREPRVCTAEWVARLDEETARLRSGQRQIR